MADDENIDIDNFDVEVPLFRLGGFIECPHCGAFRFSTERATSCCRNGSVVLTPLTVPNAIADLVKNPKILRNIRAYNQAFSISSIGGVKKDNNVNNGITQTYRVCGQMYHRYGGLHGSDKKFGGVYMLNPTEQDEIRSSVMNCCKKSVLKELRSTLEDINPYVKKFKSCRERLVENEELKLVFNHIANDRYGVYTPPSASEVGGIQDEFHPKLDMVLEGKTDGKLKYISDISSLYDSVQYMLIHPKGEQGWHPKIKKTDDSEKFVTQREFYSYHVFEREENMNNNPLTLMGPLVQQYWVDQGLKLERSRLNWVKFNQKKLRKTTPTSIHEAVIGLEDRLGTLLPSSHVGSPRYLTEHFKDTMVTSNRKGGPHLFLTMTCNPYWDEITSRLKEGQNPYHRPDLLCRVFKQKKDDLVKLLKEGKVFGKCVSYVAVTEFQDRMLPHVHMTITLKRNRKGRKLLKYINSHIYAELPDPEKQPALYEKVVKHMVHAPCHLLGKKMKCRRKGDECRFRYPKPFAEETFVDEKGFFIYRRRANGRFAPKTFGKKTHMYSNENVVPYNPFLLLRYDCHINVEYVNSIAHVKYLFSYMHKGPSCASASLMDNKDEILNYVSGRYISSCEAIWRILGYGIVERNIPVVRLPVHLKGEYVILFDDLETPEELLARCSKVECTKLTAFFDYCKKNKNETIYYEDIPEVASWTSKVDENGEIGYYWKKRVRRSSTLGRIYDISPKAGECFYLRMLLKTIPSPTSFEFLKTYKGTLYGSYRQAVVARGLLRNDREMVKVIQEISNFHKPNHIAETLANILLLCEVTDPESLFYSSVEHLTDDISGYSPTDNKRIGIAAWRVNKSLEAHGEKLSHYIGTEIVMYEYDEEDLRQRDMNEWVQDSLQNIEKLNVGQKKILDKVFKKVKEKKGGLYFIDGPAGHGKTFLLNCIIAKCLESNNVNICSVASTGVAGSLLINGSTAHSLFRIPIPVFKNSTCSIPIESLKAEALKQMDIIIWDEISMANKHAVEAVDRSLRDIRNINKPFGGVLVVFAGDFRQTLPVIKHASRGQIVGMCMKRSFLWKHVKTFRLRVNFRCTEPSFARWLIRVGNGNREEEKLPDSVNRCSSTPEVIRKVFERDGDVDPAVYFEKRMILAALNEDVDKLNDKCIDRHIGDVVVYKSVDALGEQGMRCTIKELNDLNYGYLPLHRLKLKRNIPIVIIKNIGNGILNGTRAIVIDLLEHVIKVKLLSGRRKGNIAYIFRVSMGTNRKENISMVRYQFPVKAAFAVTINRAQGQTLERCGVLLDKEVFAHGQLYVALSRIKDPKKLWILNTKKKVKNVVYKEVL